MKICPECAFANEERFPTCVWCNAVLAHVKSTPAADPAHPEHARDHLRRQRHSHHTAQRRFAAGCYVAAITFLAVVPGMIYDREVLLCIAAAAGAIAFAIVRGFLGQFSAMFLQGAASTALIVYFGKVGLLTSFTLAGHVLLPAVFTLWVDLIDDRQG